MKKLLTTSVVVLCLLSFSHSLSVRERRDVSAEDEKALLDYLKNTFETETSKVMNQQVVAEWGVATDVNNQTAIKQQADQTLKTAAYSKKVWEEHFKNAEVTNYKSEELKRALQFLKVLGSAVLDDSDQLKLNDIKTNMSNIYSTGKICPSNKKHCDLTKEGLSLDPEIEEIISTSQNYDELTYVWVAWRDATGKKIKKSYKEYVDLNNKIAELNGFKDMGEMWRKDYESDTFIEDMDHLWEEVKPLYEELHTYVKRHLVTRYPDKLKESDELIPAHILGNMWAQSWGNIFDLVKPFKDASAVDITKAMHEQNYTVEKMFQTSEEFYHSLGLENSEMCFDESKGAMIHKPKDREVLCHASAWDFQDGKDFRVKMCTKINQEDFITIHHEMGHIQYYLLYKNQPVTFRTGANPGFHEAVGDTIALSVATPQHLEKVGLLKDYKDSEESSLNALMNMALERVAFLPFGLLIDKWRWDVFSGNVDETNWNQRWWQYRNDIQKVSAPVTRTEMDFDPGAKFHVPGDSQYIAYFVAHILEFQLHKALCIAAGEYTPNSVDTKPLHKCDIYKSKAAGDKLRAGLSLGSSKHWSEALLAMTGENQLSGSAILEYFKPLYDFLKEENKKSASNPERRVDGGDKDANKDTNKAAEDQYIPIVVGSVIGALVIIAVIVFLIIKKRRE